MAYLFSPIVHTNIYKILIFLFSIFLSHLAILNDKHAFRPKISIFLPIYNKAKYLKRTIKSIQTQTTDFVWLIQGISKI